ncbi:IclR family transcriptional regulator [Actinoplanes sp. SE50]|uniref:IclR family transcriptional regulator n=1 Tax=unclassified Actinoplanes TaxID=2626549 RepID=UPI00023ECE4F|nr:MULTISPECIES: IclR family transcriptional regulator [unclassified Actinoplanes]AEV83261.1 HTH-type transcriptional repressor allR [Actinoplanes sp. SE50/110]ATO81654.1 IclR family transcriptional regulator [Actinoplanes sp. SE50]SLL99062.1 IclR family transcriptional regulator [Actinoplanes sp. SE50/110]
MARSVTGRALDLLGAFDAEHRSLTLSDLARRSGTPLTTAHRLVAELRTWGALSREPTGEYVIGRRVWQLGLLAPVQSELRTAAGPFLHDLYGATLATVHLAVRDGLEVLYVDRLGGHESVPVISKIGSRLPLHATGVGKVLLAYAPDDVLGAALQKLTRVTAYTVTQPARLLEQLRRVRADGYATTGEEMSPGACSVAVPVRNGDDVVAALGMVVPDLRRQLPRMVSALQVAARGIGRTLTSVQWK